MQQSKSDASFHNITGSSGKTIICPPLEIRSIIDRTALFTARNGPHLEERIRENEKRNIKFCFLNPSDPYHAYYEAKVNEIKEGKLPEIAETQKNEQPVEEGPQPDEENLGEKVPQFEFELDMPDISAKDLDIMKLTAQFTARRGSNFPATILMHESHNYQFNFLRPNHSLYSLFNTLVNHYSKIITPPKHILDKISRSVGSKYDILDALMVRVRHQQYEEKQHIETEQEADKERIAYASVNWHDFVIIGTVEFVEADEELELAPPLNLEDLKVMPLSERKATLIFDTNKPNVENLEEADIEVDNDSDIDEDIA